MRKADQGLPTTLFQDHKLLDSVMAYGPQQFWPWEKQNHATKLHNIT